MLSLKTIIEQYPGLFVCGAGNDAKKVINSGNSNDDDIIFNPASYTFANEAKVIVVGASNQADNGLWTGVDAFGNKKGSNYGQSTVDIFAPGDTILSCYPSAKCSECGYDDDDEENDNPNHEAVGYHYMSGTSMATPYVTGVAALIKSIHPNKSASDIKTLILNNADTKSWLTDKCVSGGRLNAYKALYASHTFGDPTASNANGHVHQCSQCQYEETAAHIFGSWKTDVYGCQYRECTECDYREREHQQPATATQKDSSTHMLSYPCCGYSVEASHSWGNWADYNAVYHRRVCTDCGYEQLQGHRAYWDDVQNQCSVCLRGDISSGGIILREPDEEAAQA